MLMVVGGGSICVEGRGGVGALVGSVHDHDLTLLD